MTDRTKPRAPSGAAMPSPLLTRALIASIVILVLVQAARFAGLVGVVGMKTVADFEVFHLVGRMIWSGHLEEAYRIATMLPRERALSGSEIFLPWTYPPLFDLVLAPFGLMPLWLAYLVFMVPCLAVYVLVLRRLAGETFGLILLAIFPAICITVGCGQNGFLSGSLVGLACLGLLAREGRGAAWAGVPLGLMAIKPHLAACLALYAFATRRWAVAAVAVAVIVFSALLATWAFGVSIWGAFLDGVRESRLFLEIGLYPLYRMVSSYAVLRTFGAPPSIAMAVQATVALLAFAAVWMAVRRGLPTRQALGIAVLTTMLVSPYAYDYDLPIYGIGLALVMPDLLRATGLRQRAALVGLSWCACGWGMAQTLVVSHLYPDGLPQDVMPLSLGGAALLALTGLIWQVLRKSAHDVDAAAIGLSRPGFAS